MAERPSASAPTGRPQPDVGSVGFGRSAGLMAIGTVLSRLTGLVRTLALAALGYEAVSHAYLKANTTPNLVYELVLGGVLSSTLVPLFVEWLDKPEDEAAEAVSVIVTLALVAGTAGAVLVFAGAPILVRLTISGPEVRLASDLLGLFAPQVIFYAVITVLTALTFSFGVIVLGIRLQ